MFLKCLLFTMLVGFAGQSVFSQSTVSGYITDSDAKPVTAATVQIRNLSKTSISDQKGFYEIVNIPSGDYLITVSCVGFKKFQKAITIGTTKTYTLNYTLKESLNELAEVKVINENENKAAIKKIEKTGFPVTVLDGASFANRAANLNDILNRQAGVKIRQDGGLGSNSRINIRGLEGNRVQVYIEGRPINGFDGNITTNDIPVQLIDRVEIYKGAVPARFGGDGLGGAVNFVLRETDKNYVDASYGIESYNTHKVNTLWRNNWTKKIQTTLGYIYNSSDNDYKMPLTATGDYTAKPDTIVRRNHDKYSNRFLVGVLKFRDVYFDEIEIELIGINNKKQFQGIEPQLDIREANNTSNVFAAVSTFKKKHFLNDNLDLLWTASRIAVRSNFVDTAEFLYDFAGVQRINSFGKGEIGAYPNNTNDLQTEYRSTFNLNYVLNDKHSINFNNQIRDALKDPHDPVANAFAGGNVYDFPGKLTQIISGLSHEYNSENGKLQNILGIKHYLFFSEGVVTQSFGSARGNPDIIKGDINKLGFSNAFRYNFSNTWLAKFSLDHSYRLPVANEVFGDGLFTVPNPSLKPEQSNNITGGIVYQKTLAGGLRRIIEFNAYNLWVSNLITLGSNLVSFGYINRDKVQITGLEAEARYDVNKNWYSSANISFINPVDDNKYIPGTGNNQLNDFYKKRLPNIPFFFFNTSFEYHKPNLFGSQGQNTRIIYENTFTEKFNYDFAVSVNQKKIVPSYFSHTVSVEHSFMDQQLFVTAEVNNITNALIINNFGNPLPGTVFRFKIRYVNFYKSFKNKINK